MNPIVLAVLIVAILGLVAGLLLAIASIVMAVPVDEKAVAIEEVLAGANCGACGYSGCAGYAAALAAGECEDTSLCSPGGSACAKAVAEIMGVAAGDSTPMTAVVLCHGTEANAANIMDYHGDIRLSRSWRLRSGLSLRRHPCRRKRPCGSRFREVPRLQDLHQCLPEGCHRTGSPLQA